MWGRKIPRGCLVALLSRAADQGIVGMIKDWRIPPKNRHSPLSASPNWSMMWSINKFRKCWQREELVSKTWVLWTMEKRPLTLAAICCNFHGFRHAHYAWMGATKLIVDCLPDAKHRKLEAGSSDVTCTKETLRVVGEEQERPPRTNYKTSNRAGSVGSAKLGRIKQYLKVLCAKDNAFSRCDHYYYGQLW
jgi:hypothetical protein